MTADNPPVRPLVSTVTASDPQAVYRQMREEWGNVARVELEPGVHAWLVMGWDELRIITSHEHLYSRDSRNWKDWQDGVVAPDSNLGPMMFHRDNVIGHDLDKHRRLRKPLDDAMASIDQRKLRRAVQANCAELIEGFAADGHADLVADYAQVVPMLAIGNLVGLDTAGGHELRRILIAVVSAHQEDSYAANQQFEKLLFDLVTSRRAAPADDFTTMFVQHPDLHDDAEILQTVIAVIAAGNEVSTTWIAQTLRVMLTDDRFGARMRGGRLGVNEALDEVLWTDPPLPNFAGRYALRDTVLGGRQIAKGDALIMGMAGANADPRIHTGDPRLELGNQAHMAWGAGPHTCPAKIPARVIARTAVETVLHLLRGVRLTIEPDEVRFNPGLFFRCPTSLPVTFTPGTVPAPKPLISQARRPAGSSR